MNIDRVKLIALLSDLEPHFVPAADESVDDEIELRAVPNLSLQLNPDGLYICLSEWNAAEKTLYDHGMWDDDDSLSMETLAHKIRAAIKVARA